MNIFSFREQEYYYQEQDQRSDDKHFLNIYFKYFNSFNEKIEIENLLKNKLDKLNG